MVHIVDEQRHQAELAAAKARSTVRKLHDEKLFHMAREEGRRIGIREGMEMGMGRNYEPPALDGEDFQPPRHDHQDTWDEEEDILYPGEFSSEGEEESQLDSFYTQGPTRRPADTRTVGTTRTSSPAPIPAPPPPADRGRTGNERFQPIGEIHPVIVDMPPNMPGPPHFPPVPPDGYIPEAGPDNYIRLPPPHDLHRRPMTPERQPSPTLSAIPERDERHATRTPGSRSVRTLGSTTSGRVRRGHRHSSPGSNSTTMSQFDSELLNDPLSKASPMSVIPEVHSGFTSPHPDSLGRDVSPMSLKNQPSFVSSDPH